MPSVSTCVTVPDEDPAGALHCDNISVHVMPSSIGTDIPGEGPSEDIIPDMPEETSSLISVPPVTRGKLITRTVLTTIQF